MQGVNNYVILCINLQRSSSSLKPKSWAMAKSNKQTNLAIYQATDNKFRHIGHQLRKKSYLCIRLFTRIYQIKT